MPVVASTLREVCGKKVGVVALAQFSSGAHAEVYAALRRASRSAARRAYVLDLQGNGGGLVDEAQLIASAFLEDGPIVTTRGRSVPERTLTATGDPIIAKAPLVVLVNRGTASASEIVAGALQDRGRAKLVGTRTFGKGVFQEVLELSNGGALDITAGQYFTPKGRNLGGRGVRRAPADAGRRRRTTQDAAGRGRARGAATSRAGGLPARQRRERRHRRGGGRARGRRGLAAATTGTARDSTSRRRPARGPRALPRRRAASSSAGAA